MKASSACVWVMVNAFTTVATSPRVVAVTFTCPGVAVRFTVISAVMDVGELTVKLRTSKGSIADRVEVDIPLGEYVFDSDINAFLQATGWKKELTLHKHSTIVHVHSISYGGLRGDCPPVIIAFYTVSTGLLGKPGSRSFIEVELNKATLSKLPGAEGQLDLWEKWFQRRFGNFPKEHLNSSLYELYTGKTYQMAPKEKQK